MQNENDWQREELVDLRGKNIESDSIQEELKEQLKTLQEDNRKLNSEVREKVKEHLAQ